ncbi:MAG: hypothetical protein K6T76_09185 [Alicyclobacillus mali]|uniref:hypothetical protein n=1 Tax=Alicyclobacillus mali (ex Roth et al. 2021) TaxID=1123961 RepID=UPI0023F53803|nr:hypothetical protein [Alicyclobacillus mali (ex Roth et al. 2021)]MCL6489093.1 hypothetical protein [Alicyclobacillus mali (ex Roth et al. 2021)]
MLFNLLWRFAVIGFLLGGGVINFIFWKKDNENKPERTQVLGRTLLGGFIGLVVFVIAGIVFYMSVPHHPVH